MDISVKANLDKLQKEIRFIERDQIPYSAMIAINETARNVRTTEYRHMQARFKKPTRYTVPANIETPKKSSSLFIQNTNKKILTARVWVKDLSQGKGTAAIKYLGPQIFGGPRGAKASENSLRRKGLIGGNKFITPSTRSQYGSVKLNQFGNVKAGMMTKILSGLKALPSTPKGTKSRQKQTYFVMRLGGRGSETGIWTRKGGQLQKLFNVTDQPTYSPRLRWWSVAEKTIRNKFDGNFRRAFREAMRTAR